MQLIKKTLPVDHNLFLFGDLHIGSVLFSEKRYFQFVDAFCSPYAGLDSSRNYAVCHGDVIEASTN